MTNQLDTLETLVPQLPAKDVGFALSLISKGRKYGCSAGQTKWVGILIQRAQGVSEERTKVAIGSLEGITARFAAAKVNRPKIVLGIERKGFTSDKSFVSEFTLSVATERARCPGTIDVKGAGTWYGRILKDGNFEQSPRVRDLPEGLVDLLRRFADKPAETAAEFGRMTGRCTFCNTPLRTGVSTTMGYGPVCAKKWNLPWGVTAAKSVQ